MHPTKFLISFQHFAYSILGYLNVFLYGLFFLIIIIGCHLLLVKLEPYIQGMSGSIQTQIKN